MFGVEIMASWASSSVRGREFGAVAAPEHGAAISGIMRSALL